MRKKLNLLKHPPRKAGAPLSDAQLEAWAATERDPRMREDVLAITQGTPVPSTDDRPRDPLHDPWFVVWVLGPVLIWLIEDLGTTRLLDAPPGYLGTRYHYWPGAIQGFMWIVPSLVVGFFWHVFHTDTDGRRWPAVALGCFALFSLWQVVPSMATRWLGTPHSEVAMVANSLVGTNKGRLRPDRLVVLRPSGRLESISYHATSFTHMVHGSDEYEVGIRLSAGDWVRLSGERTALGFLVHHVARAPTPP